jgi:UDP-N-acetylglucosamine diphosphorylase / glucose-1-phosphate thymidylyltransferase / UDP-N-acetylgalactosamine diphosphorylase / glucosamine-1-phosphate N-acetyltransferase / galactosamine-1-phosphate N-acetyltransferase
MEICLFEDTIHPVLLPLTHAQPDFDLRCGAFTVRERTAAEFADAELSLQVRPFLAEVMRERSGLAVNERRDSVTLFLNGCALPDRGTFDAIRARLDLDCIFSSGGRVVACTTPGKVFRAAVQEALEKGGLPPDAAGATGVAVESPTLTHPWDIIEANPALLVSDRQYFPSGVNSSAELAASAELIGSRLISVGSGVRIGSGVVLDATDGPIIIDEGAYLMPHAVVLGPVYIGKYTKIKVGARIYGGTSIGPSCKIGGEVEGSIFHSFASKQHEGFVGHSYFAQWTNLGADTNTSDLKNNYSGIRVTLEGREYSTGRRFLGTIMADHSKCGINTMFNTGTCVGVGCNVYGGQFPPKHIPAFSWGSSEGFREHDFDRFAETASIVMNRRGRSFTEREHDVYRHVFQVTAELRVHHSP